MNIIIFLSAFLISCSLTPIIQRLAIKNNLVVHPQANRWHKKSTPILGGIAIFAGTLIPILLFVPKNEAILGIILGGCLLFVWGLLDDIKNLSPQIKLLGQIIASCISILAGIIFNIPLVFVSIPVTMLWIIGITNSFNLLDNMDGLSAGIAAISSIMLFISSGVFHNEDVGLIALILCGATLGFLPFNFNPAKIFMGDCGSMFIGFVLATISIIGTYRHVSNLMVTLLIPVLILAIPIFDTSLVILMRKLHGFKISVGGKDHASHRLVALGLSERKTVLLLYILSILFGLIALLYSKIDIIIVSIFAVLTLIVLVFFGIFLAEVRVYNENDPENKLILKSGEGKVIINTLILHKRRITEVLIDFTLILVAYFSAYLLRFEGIISDANLFLIKKSLPWILPIKLIAFFYFGLYSGVWRYASISDLIAILKAITASSALSVLITTFIFRFQDYSRVVFILDWMLTVFFICGVRILIRVLAEYFTLKHSGGKRALIVGAGDTGEMILREMRRNRSANYLPIGFIDDSPTKIGRKIHGIPILGNRHSLVSLVTKEKIDEILISIPKHNTKNFDELCKICESCKIPYRLVGGVLRMDDNE